MKHSCAESNSGGFGTRKKKVKKVKVAVQEGETLVRPFAARLSELSALSLSFSFFLHQSLTSNCFLLLFFCLPLSLLSLRVTFSSSMLVSSQGHT